MVSIVFLSTAGLLVISAIVWQWRIDNPERRLTGPAFVCSPSFLKIFAGILIVIGGVAEYRSQFADFKNLVGSVTGGDSFVYLSLESVDANFIELSFVLQHEGQHPVYDIQLDVYKTDERWNVWHEGMYRGWTGHKFVRVLSPGHPPMLTGHLINAWDYQADPVPPNSTYFKVVITTRNNFYVQYFRLDNSRPEWLENSAIFEADEDFKNRHNIGDTESLLDSLKNRAATSVSADDAPPSSLLLRRRR